MGTFFKDFFAFFGPYGGSVVLTNLFAVLFGAAIFVSCWRMVNDWDGRIPNLLLAVLGALCGWALGIFFTPFSPTEKALFASAGQVISAFLSGYVFAKLDRYLEAQLFTPPPNPTSWLRLAIFACSLMLVFVTVSSNRLYFLADPPPQQTGAPKTP